MQYIALNGFRHTLHRYFNTERVICTSQFDWNRRTIEQFSKTIRTPTTLIGFSDGATAALAISQINDYVKFVYAHSPMYISLTHRPINGLTLFRTQGDTTPTFKATLRIFHELEHSSRIELHTLPPGKPEPVRDFGTLMMRLKGHQFRNCLPLLPQELLWT